MGITLMAVLPFKLLIGCGPIYPPVRAVGTVLAVAPLSLVWAMAAFLVREPWARRQAIMALAFSIVAILIPLLPFLRLIPITTVC